LASFSLRSKVSSGRVRSWPISSFLQPLALCLPYYLIPIQIPWPLGQSCTSMRIGELRTILIQFSSCIFKNKSIQSRCFHVGWREKKISKWISRHFSTKLDWIRLSKPFFYVYWLIGEAKQREFREMPIVTYLMSLLLQWNLIRLLEASLSESQLETNNFDMFL